MENEFIQLPDFSELTGSVKEIWQENKFSDEVTTLKTTGKSITLNEAVINETGIYTVLSDGTIKKVLLYSSEAIINPLEKEPPREPKFHLFRCETLNPHLSPLPGQPIKKFNITTRKDSKFYFVVRKKLVEGGEQIEEIFDKPIQVCGFCLKIYIKMNENSSLINAENFNPAEYLQKDHGKFPIAFKFDFDTVPGVYKTSWQAISDFYKNKKKYVCEKCLIALNEGFLHKFLNIHYIEKKIEFIRIDRIKNLCVLCHAEEPGHSHIKKTTDYESFKRYVDSKKRRTDL
jgi:hypothetical protein